ncbi:MAG: 50S ribosomal protein L1 [Gammaproteobacteria bacterium]|nr:50S ribosomal protein L1 [Gammaproteobacteria bacterium]
MSKHSKKQKDLRASLTPGKQHPILAAVELVKKCSTVKFDASVDVAMVLGVDGTKSDQAVRGATIMPNGTGKTVRVAVFAQGDQAKAALAAGADIVGFDDLAEAVKSGNFAADVVIATPDAMRLVGQLGQILGPKGLMPNPKVGTVSNDAAMAVKNAKSGQVRYRSDKNGIIHCSIGKVSFSPESIKQNVEALLIDLKKAKPSTAKGMYLKKLVISSTMGPALHIDLSSLSI